LIAWRFIFALCSPLPGSSALLMALLLALGGSANAEDSHESVVIQDAHFGEVLFYFYQEDYFPAIVRLLAAQKKSQMGHHEAESELLLGGLYLSYGHHLRAAEIFERLLADNANPAIRDRTWFFLAKIWQQRGYLAESQNALDHIQGELPDSMQAERHMLQAQLLINQGDYNRAIELLQGWSGRTEWASYARFNLGVAMVRSGRVDDAVSILDDLGNMKPYNEELNSLRDKANLALGFALIQGRQPHAAKAALQRVRLEGPFSNKALLGVGWADAELNSYRRALVPWMELRSRDLLDSAVQESMLAIPFAMAKLDSISQAADHYLNAVEAYYEETNRIDQAIERIESGTLFAELLQQDTPARGGWFWRLQDLPEVTESRYLFHLLATNKFQEGLKNYRDLSYLSENLQQWQESIEVYSNMLDTRKLAYIQRLPRVEQSLSEADIDEMVNRKLDLDARLNGIEQSRDSLALANAGEFALWGEIAALERNPALQADIPEAQEVRDKISLLKGVLQWNLDRDFKSRLWRTRRDLRQTGEALVETQRSRRQVDESMRQEPTMFGELTARVNGLRPRIDRLRLRVEEGKAKQLGFLQEIAVDELQAQKQRLDTYTVQARFALATIYDRSAALGDATR